MSKVDVCPECGSMTVRISWSSLKTWEECRQRGKLTREKKRAKATDVRNFFPGRVTDRVVRYWLSDDPLNNRGGMPDMVESVVATELGDVEKNKEEIISWRHQTDRDDVIRQCIEAVKNIEPALERYVLPYTWQVDFGFRTPVLMQSPWGMERVVLNGYMDIIVYDPETDTWRIYDVKHTENKDYWKGSFGQLVFYGYENQVRTGQIPLEVGFFQPLVKESVKRFKIDETHINQLAGRVQSMAWEIWNDITPPRRDNKFCGFCDVKHACIKFKPMTDDKGNTRVSLLG
jgi:hypothetical protein